MKLISPPPPPSRHYHRNNPRRGSFLRRLRSRVFSVRMAWWIFVAVVATFAYTIVQMMRHQLEANMQ